MIPQLPEMPLPDWLNRINAGNIGQQFPLNDILQNSLFYPAAAIDGDPVKYLAGNFLSFIYVDFSFDRGQLMEHLNHPGFKGYDVAAQRSVDLRMIDRGVPDFTLPNFDHRVDMGPFARKDPFCEWIIFRRKEGGPPTHGPLRFSLLYLCGEGVAVFRTLYVANRICPAAVAIIQPGGWTRFEDPTGPLGEAVLENRAGKPRILLYGGVGPRHFYRQPCWPEFSEKLAFLARSDGSIGVWHRRRNGAYTAATKRS